MAKTMSDELKQNVFQPLGAERTKLKTLSGNYVNLLEPDPNTILLDDISWGLSHIGRYGGHTRSFYPVSEHSIYVAAMLHRLYGDNLLSLGGLLHDSPEAYLGDVVLPLKEHLGDYGVIENNFARVIEQRFHLPFFFLDDPRIKEVDSAIVPWEMVMIRDNRFRIASNPRDLRQEFRRAFYQYGGKE